MILEFRKRPLGAGVTALEIKGNIHCGPECARLEREVDAMIAAQETRVVLDMGQVTHAGVSSLRGRHRSGACASAISSLGERDRRIAALQDVPSQIVIVRERVAQDDDAFFFRWIESQERPVAKGSAVVPPDLGIEPGEDVPGHANVDVRRTRFALYRPHAAHGGLER